MVNVSIVSVPYPFVDEGRIVRQRNALRSWALLEPKPEILLLGGEQGVDAAANEIGARCIGEIEKTRHGYFSMRSIFDTAAEQASNDLICYVDTDVILLDTFLPTVAYVAAHFEQFLIVSGRWHSRIDRGIDFDLDDWQAGVCDWVTKLGVRGSDIAVYRRGLYYGKMPNFSIGAAWWDGWRMWHARESGAAVVNVEWATKAVHQDHGSRYTHRKEAFRENKRLAGDKMIWVKQATHEVRKKEVDQWLGTLG